MKPLKILVVVSFFVLAGLQSCKKDNGVAPDLPPQSAFSVPEMSDFDQNKNLVDKTSVHWIHSAVNVWFWNTAVFIGMAVPVASFVESFNHEAEFQSGTTWMWQYSFEASGSTFTAKLYGTVRDEVVDWEMFISRSGHYKDFLWYSGTSQSDGTGCEWTLYKSPEVPTELLLIEWFKTTDKTGNITYTNIEPEGNENGGYIKYGNDDESDLNAYYLIYNKGQDNLCEIEWSQENKNGRVKDENRFGDTEWHCWDENLQDVECE